MNVLITGSTGMVGEAVLIECLEDPRVDTVVILNRRSLNRQHPNLEEVLIDSYEDLDQVSHQLKGLDGCFHCMGTSAVGKSEDEYHKITFEYTKSLVDIFYRENPYAVFNYVSGDGTDSTEKGNTMWARVKGKTENYILNKGFKDAYMFRAGAILPQKGVRSKTKLYDFIYIITRPLFPLMKKLNSITTSSRVGRAMINTLFYSQPTKHLQNKDINAFATKNELI